jgi:hypothetical protein
MARHKGTFAHTQTRADQTSRLTATDRCLLSYSSYSSIFVAELCVRASGEENFIGPSVIRWPIHIDLQPGSRVITTRTCLIGMYGSQIKPRTTPTERYPKPSFKNALRMPIVATPFAVESNAVRCTKVLNSWRDVCVCTNSKYTLPETHQAGSCDQHRRRPFPHAGRLPAPARRPGRCGLAPTRSEIARLLVS